MAVKLIADPHGHFDGLEREVGPGDTLLVLGDILDLIDWSDISGILADVMGRETLIQRLLAALKTGPEAAVALRDELIAPGGAYSLELMVRIQEQYEAFRRALEEIGCRAHVIWGNGDVPDLLAAALDGADGVTLGDGVHEIEGRRFGFASGALYSPFRMPAEMEDEEFGERLLRLGKVDVLCTHIPPRVDSATMDVVAGRPVEGSESLLRYLEENRPTFHYHGHVHQPAQRELIIAGTRAINVGYYKRTGYVHTHDGRR